MAKNQAPVGAPPWMVTFADLMSLLVCFFVLITDPTRLAMVTGKADTDHLFPEQPRDPRNRRISITLLRQEPLPDVPPLPAS
jgi:flagellar motor protein MotB